LSEATPRLIEIFTISLSNDILISSPIAV